MKINSYHTLEARTLLLLFFWDPCPLQEGWGTTDCDGFVCLFALQSATAAFWHYPLCHYMKQ